MTAIGCALPHAEDTVPAALSLAMPTVRYRKERLVEWVEQLRTTAGCIGADPRAHAVADTDPAP